MFLCLFLKIVHFASIASLTSRIEIFRNRIWNRISAFFKYNLYYNFLIFIFYHFNSIKVNEIFYALLRIHFVKSNYSSIAYFSECTYILCTTSRVYVYCLLFLVFRLYFARGKKHFLWYFISKKSDSCSNMFRPVERIPSPSCYSMREIEAQWHCSSWRLDVWNFLETIVLFVA